LVSAMNSMRMLASPTHMPMRYFSGSAASSLVQPGGQSFEPEGREPNGSPPEPGPPAPIPGLISTSVVRVVGICRLRILDFGFPESLPNPKSKIQNPKFLVSVHLCWSRLGLHHVVSGCT